MKLQGLIVGVLLIPAVRADDYSDRVQALKKNQANLDQMISPFRSLSGFKESSALLGEDGEKKHPIIQFHNSPNKMQAEVGKLLFGRTFNRLIVGTEKSPVIIELKSGQQSFSDLRAIGTASQGSTAGRINIEITKIVFKGGSSKAVNGLGLDKNGAFGIEAQVISQKALSVAGAMASSLISGVAASQQTSSTNAFGFQSIQTTPHNALLGGLAQTAADQSKRLIEESTSEKPVMVVESNTEVAIMLQEEVRF